MRNDDIVMSNYSEKTHLLHVMAQHLHIKHTNTINDLENIQSNFLFNNVFR